MKTNSKKYVDGFVIPIKKKDVAAYKKMAEWGARMWKKNGALEYFECIGDDLKIKKEWPQKGFIKLAELKADETVVFSWIVYKSKAHRDQVNKKVMSDPSMKDFDPSTMPVDMKRFASGGFKPIVEA
jgi:alkaline phosphatase